MSRHIVGLDLNGWRDFGCRDWNVDDPGLLPDVPCLIEGGRGSVVVNTDVSGEWVGGPQAILSPIGRGSGWGEIGLPSRRRALVDLWREFLEEDKDPTIGVGFSAVAESLARQADEVVFCMPDVAAMDEARQDELLKALRGYRRPRPTLLWRSVAVVLDLLDGGENDGALKEDMRIALLTHGSAGFELQHFQLRSLPEAGRRLTPERDGTGAVLAPELGLSRLLALAGKAVGGANPALRERPCEAPRMPIDLLFADDEPGEEIVRRDTGDWLALRPPVGFTLSNVTPLELEDLSADLFLLDTPLPARHEAWLKACLPNLAWHRAAPGAAARGALFAGRRIQCGIPHYLDHLDQIALAVLGMDGPLFEDLIPPDAVVAGNREYAPAPITSLAWSAGMTRSKFFIRKGEREIRRWESPEIAAPDDAQRLEVHLRQKPAQGRARLTVTAPDWELLRRSPIHLDWEGMALEERSEAEILKSLERPPPAVPQRICYRPHIGLWDGSLSWPRLIAPLDRVDIDDPDSLGRLVTWLRSRRIIEGGTCTPVGSDGDLPPGLDSSMRNRFDEILRQLAEQLLRNIRRNVAGTDNLALLCLTWSYARCPAGIQEELRQAARSGRHPLLKPPKAKRVVIQGLGRVTTDADALGQFIPHFSAYLNNNDYLGAFAALVSRPAAAPLVLAEKETYALCASRLREVLASQLEQKNFKISFKYALLALGGLLRVREVSPWALVADRSQQARDLVNVLEKIASCLTRGERNIRGLQEKREITEELIKYLNGSGGAPDILAIAENIPDS